MYTKKSAQLYDSWHTHIDEFELHFFEQLIKNSSSALELGCGTGRLLLPFLSKGYNIEGIDSSEEMLALCKKKAVKKGLEPLLYHQKIQNMALPKKYELIFSALDTFGYIAKKDDALKALSIIYNHLDASGMFVVCLSLSWLYAPENAAEWRVINQATIDNEIYTLYEKSIHDPHEQLFYHYYRIQKEQIVVDEFETVIRWYSRYEFTNMLIVAGFSNISVKAGYTGDGPQDLMIFTAHKV